MNAIKALTMIAIMIAEISRDLKRSASHSFQVMVENPYFRSSTKV